jgi:hypothetical protein
MFLENLDLYQIRKYTTIYLECLQRKYTCLRKLPSYHNVQDSENMISAILDL